MKRRHPYTAHLLPWVVFLGIGLGASYLGAPGALLIVGLAVAGLLLAVR